MKTYLSAVLVVAGVSTPAFAQGPPDPRAGATTPVHVVNTTDNPVPVTGEVKFANSLLDVAVVNDIVTSPYMVNRSQAFSGGETVFRTFDIPDGMRLIIETMTVRAALGPGGNAVAQFSALLPENTSIGGELAMQPQGTLTLFGQQETWLIGTHAVKLRIDAVPGEDDELVIAFRTNGGGTVNAFVAGYLVPLK